MLHHLSVDDALKWFWWLGAFTSANYFQPGGFTTTNWQILVRVTLSTLLFVSSAETAMHVCDRR
jgi:hypothetical protein